MEQKQTINLSTANPINGSNFSFPLPQSSYVTFNTSYNCWQNIGIGASIVFNLNLAQKQGVNLILGLCSSTVNGIASSPISISVNGYSIVSNFVVTYDNFWPYAWYIQSSFLNVGNNTIQITLQPGQNATPIWINSATAVIFAMQHQTQTNWCWSAVATSVSIYYNSSSAWTQCSLANNALGQTTCCSNPGSSACNIPWYLDGALNITGNLASVVGSAVPFDAVQGQTNQGLPLGARQGWAGGGGHFMVLIGVNNNGTQMVAVEDPWYGQSYIAYNTFVKGYKGSGTWTTTYYTKQSN